MWGVILGGFISIVTAMLIEYFRRPALHLQIDQPIDLSYSGQYPAQQVRFVRVMVHHRALPWAFRWMARETASLSTATVSFHHLDGQNVFGRDMTGRWSGSPEPVPNHIILGHEEGRMWDLGRLTAPQRMDIPVGTAEPVDVAGRFDNDPECYGWSNASYFSQPTTPLAANQLADRVAQPGAIIPPVLELPQATWLQGSRRWLRRRWPVYAKSS